MREAELCDYSSVKGCLNYLPNGYAIWELIQADLDRRFKETGVENVSLPLLSGILTGTTLIPVFFYTYSGILGFTVVWIDIAIFYLCTGITFFNGIQLYEQKNIARFRFLIYGLTILYSILFFIFTFIQPDIALFKSMTFHTASAYACFFFLSVFHFIFQSVFRFIFQSTFHPR